VPVQTRSDRFQSVTAADFPAVTGREPEWKLSPVAKLRPLIDAKLDGSAYGVGATSAAGFSFSFRPAAEVGRGVAGLPEDRAAAAVERLAELHAAQKLLDRPLAAIDLRLPDRLVLRLPPAPEDAPAAPAAAQRGRSGRG
jgi:hypothetical protein